MDRTTDRFPKSQCSKGFTLVEVVTAALLGAMLLAIFLTFAFRFTQVFKELGGAQVKIASEANRVLDVIEGDLASSIMRQDPYEWMSYWADFNSAQSAFGSLEKTAPPLGDRLTDFELDKTGVLLCITQAPKLSEEEKDQGDVLSVAWRLAYLDPAIPEAPHSAGATYCLYRITNLPGVTFENFLTKENLADPWSGNKSSSGVNFSADPPYDINTLYPEFLQLHNVVEFSIQFHCPYLPDNSSSGLTNSTFVQETKYHKLLAPVRIGGAQATNDQGPADLARLSSLFPVTAIVRLTVLSDEGVKYFKAAAIEDKRPNMENLEQLIEQHGHTYQRTVVLPRPI